MEASAQAVDIALGKGDPWQISNAVKIMSDTRVAHGLVDKTPAAPRVDPFDVLIAEIRGDSSPVR